MKIDAGTLRGLDAHRQAKEGLVAHLQELETEADGQAMSADQLTDFEETVKERDALQAVIGQLEIRASEIERALAEDKGIEKVGAAYPSFNVRKSPENVYDLSAYRQRAGSVDELPSLYRDGAMRVLDQASFPTMADSGAGRDQVARLLARHKDEANGVLARRIIGTDNPQYREAWAEYVAKGPGALSPSRLAVLQTYSDTDGGYAIPFTLDPTIINTSDGSVNPLRQIARVETITTKSWQAVTSAGVTASYVGERTNATGASDSAPSDLLNPTATPLRADVDIDVSAEFLEDYGAASVSAQVGSIVQIAKDDLEATKFVMGAGTTEPNGVVAALITDTTSIVLTATDNVFALADIDNLIAETPPRFRSRGRFMGNLAILQLIPPFGTAGQPGNSIYDALSGRLRGYPVHEATAMDDVATDAKEILLFGDFKAGFVIVDRIGLSTEVLPSYDASGRPTGGRSLYAHWRNTSQLLFPNAFRLLKVR